jgi:hypothetical protein
VPGGDARELVGRGERGRVGRADGAHEGLEARRARRYVDPDVLERSLAALRQPIAESYAALDKAEAVARELPHRARVLSVNHRLARRIIDAHAWLDEAEAELRGSAARRR